MNPYALLPLAGFLANAVLAAFVLARNPRSAANRLLALLALGIAYWALLKFAWRLSADADAALLLYRASAPGWCLLPSLYLHFVVALAFPDAPRSRRLQGLLFALHAVGAGFAACAVVGRLMVVEMVLEPWGFVHVPGPLFVAFTSYLVLLFAASAALLVRAIRSTSDAAHRRSLWLVLVGICVPVVGGLVTNMLLPMHGTRSVELGEVLSTVNVALVAFAMRRYDLLAVSLSQAAETILASMGDALLVAGPRGDVVLTNATAERLLGAPSSALLGRPISSIVRAPALFAALGERPSESQQGEGELASEHGGPVPVVLSLTPLRVRTAGAGIVCVAQDIGRLRRAMTALELANERLALQAVTDDLTGAANRRQGLARLQEELGRARRYRHSFSVGLLDLDGFKEVNDRHGHLGGDRVLQHVTGALRASLRGGDLVARWGGDEFLLLFQEQAPEGAIHVAERILERLAALRVPDIDTAIGASLGIVSFVPEADMEVGMEDLLRRADDALYRAKREGKGRLCVHEPAPRATGV